MTEQTAAPGADTQDPADEAEEYGAPEGGLTLREAAARLSRMTEQGLGLPEDSEADGEEAAETPATDVQPDAPPEAEGAPVAAASAPVTLKIDGVAQTVSLDELKAGYQRHADYTRKTQALAAERRGLAAERENYQRTLSRLRENLALSEVGPPDQKFLETDPAAYARQSERWRQRQGLAEAVAAEQSRLQALLTRAEEEEQAQNLAVETQRMAAVIPGWSDPQVRERGKFDIASYLVGTYGATAEDLNDLTDHRLVLLCHKAMLYDRLMSQRPLAEKRVRGLPRVQKPGTARTQREQDQAHAQALRDRFRKTGSIRDAAKLLSYLGD